MKKPTIYTSANGAVSARWSKVNQAWVICNAVQIFTIVQTRDEAIAFIAECDRNAR